ncbi:hypothetical protein [Streptomyces torulosus]|uniref:hypothetical protein n=1 Tax=Streptomyces torulosus TaxID=68276 RepID=UPI000AF12CBA|nr:hypothetical protein [Streptomyces torulosus]
MGREPGADRGDGRHGGFVQPCARHVQIQVPADHQAQRRAPDDGRCAYLGQQLVEAEVLVHLLRLGAQRVLLLQHP